MTVVSALGVSMWADKMALMLGGAKVMALSYARASKDQKRKSYSVDQQSDMNNEEIEKNGWTKLGEYSDNDESASRFRRKAAGREDFAELLKEIKTGKANVLVLVDVSRSQRDLEVFAMLRNLCFENGCFFWLVNGNLYDLRVTADRNSLANMAVQGETFSDAVSDGVSRGLAKQKKDGRPASRCPYGYERFKDQKTGAFDRQVFDVTERTAVHTETGTVEEYTTSDVVENIFRQLRKLTTSGAIARDLNSRGIPSPGGLLWSRQTVEFIARNAAYMGKRASYGTVVSDGQWEGIVSPAVFMDVQRILDRDDKGHDRTGRKAKDKPDAEWLLSYAARCAECGAWLESKHKSANNGAAVVYRCSKKYCSSVNFAKFDSYVESVLVAWLSRPDVYQRLISQRRVNDASIKAHEDDIALAERQLGENKALRMSGAMHPDDFVDMQKDLRDRIELAEKTIRAAAVPDIIQDLVGPDAAEQWAAIPEVATRREIIKMVCAPLLHKANKNPRMPIEKRVSFGGFMKDLAA
ncbi:recombinase family protein [Kribbella qitaiheensis]|nr:recombinase family protein [Kribbella qitaiheensis]